MGKLRQLSPELWPLIDLILYSYMELIFRGGVSCLPAALLCSLCVFLFRIFFSFRSIFAVNYQSTVYPSFSKKLTNWLTAVWIDGILVP